MILEVKGGNAIIDEQDYLFLNQFKWHKEDTGYIKSTIYTEDRAPITIRMHQLVVGRCGDLWVDHINRVRHDNRRGNLRHVTPKENWLNSITAISMFHMGVLKDVAGYKKLHQIL
jgi:hypothetical protein